MKLERDFNAGYMPPYMDYNMPPPNMDMNDAFSFSGINSLPDNINIFPTKILSYKTKIN